MVFCEKLAGLAHDLNNGTVLLTHMNTLLCMQMYFIYSDFITQNTRKMLFKGQDYEISPFLHFMKVVVSG